MRVGPSNEEEMGCLAVVVLILCAALLLSCLTGWVLRWVFYG